MGIEEQYLNIQTPVGNPRRSMYLPAALADLLVDRIPEEATVPIEDTGLNYISRDHVPHIAELLQEIVAYTVSGLINAGSERDAVMENDELAQALERELYGWCEPEGNSTDED